MPVLPAAIGQQGGQPVMTPAASVPATVPMVVVPITTPSDDGGSAGNLGDNVGDGMAVVPAIHVDYSEKESQIKKKKLEAHSMVGMVTHTPRHAPRHARVAPTAT